MIRIFNSACYGERLIPLEEAEIIEQKIDAKGRPFIFFEHTDYPFGGLRAWYDGTYWQCDLD
jgi:hypothetical protein